MKHVFIAHSHTLLLTSLGVIQYLKIDAGDVVFLCTRNYNSRFFIEGSLVIRADECDELGEVIQKSDDKKFIKENIKKIDHLIGQWIQDEYELYVPHLWGGFLNLLYTHPLCVGLSYVQEGAHISKKFFVPHIPLFKKCLKKLRLLLRYGNIRFYSNAWYVDGVLKNKKELKAYAIYKDYFEYMPCKTTIVSWPQLDFALPVQIDGPVFVFDGFVTNGLADSDYYYEQCKLLIERFHQAKNYIKFHPAQKRDECDALIDVFKTYGVEFKELDPTIPFELYIIKNKGMTVVGMGSSLLYFAHSNGHKVICCDSWMMGDARYKRNHDSGYPLFHEFFDDAKEIKK